MLFALAQSSACSAHHCHANVVRRVSAEPETSAQARMAEGVEKDCPRPQNAAHAPCGASKCSQNRVCTMCTPWASDSVVPATDWAGLGMFLGEWRIFRGSGWFESHLGHVFPCHGPFLGL
jgi:hypothetical protein